MTTTPPDHVLVPRVGTTVSIVGHPQGPFIVYERKVDEYLPHSICVRGENTAWFAVELLAPSPPTSGGVNAGLLERISAVLEQKCFFVESREGWDAVTATLREYRGLLKQAITTAESAQAVTAEDDDEGDFVSCESCDNARVPHEDAISAGDGYLCPKCHAEWRKEFETCEHDWHPHHDEYGDECRICHKCSGIDYPDAAKTPTIAAGDDLAWLDEIEAREAKATLGPWETDGFAIDPRNEAEVWAGEVNRAAKRVVDSTRREDADFIAHARTDIPKLTTALRQSLSRHKDDAGKVTDEFVEALTKVHMDEAAKVPDLERKAASWISIDGTYYYRGVAYDNFNAAKLAQQKDIMRIALQAALAPTEGER